MVIQCRIKKSADLRYQRLVNGGAVSSATVATNDAVTGRLFLNKRLGARLAQLHKAEMGGTFNDLILPALRIQVGRKVA